MPDGGLIGPQQAEHQDGGVRCGDVDNRRASLTTVRLVPLLLAVGLAGCGAGQIAPGSASGPTPGPTGVLHIVATEGPTCPVQRVGGPACTRPHVGQVDVRSSSGALVAEPTTSQDGTADVTVSAGTYTISAPESSNGFPRLTQPIAVTVGAGGTATATLDFDTGIR